MENRTYSDRNEAIQREIVEPINAGDTNANNYNTAAIADAVLGGHEDGYALKVNADEFWEIVEANELSEKDRLGHIVELFEAGVQPEDAALVLGMYLETGAKIKLAWKFEPEHDIDTYIVKLMVSTVDDFDNFEPLSFVFGNEDLMDECVFYDGKNGDHADDGSYPYERCENRLLSRFGLTRYQLDRIDGCW